MNSNYFNQNFPYIVSSIKTAKKNNKLSHAYLVYSDDIETRHSFAYFLAKILACASKDDPVPCETCSRCVPIDKDTSQDLYRLEPVSKSRRITIGKENEPNTMRWFQSRFFYSSLISNAKKIGIIFEADRLVIEAQNAFLKTLEEPPRNSNFILVTGNRHILLPTILSRCQFISVVTNKTIYDFNHAEELFAILHELLLSKRSITKADAIITSLTNIFSSINNEARKEVSTDCQNELDQLLEMDSSEKKQFNTELEAAIAASYLLKRDKIINTIYVWAAEIYQMSLGIERKYLANPEIFSKDIAEESSVGTERASKILSFAERFSSSMKFNIDESLPIYELVMNIIFKTQV